MKTQLSILCVYLFAFTAMSQKLPTAFTGIVQGGLIAKKGEHQNTSPHGPLTDGCFNQHECCATLHSMGQCVHHRSDLKLWCPQACGFCEADYNPSIECVDRHLDCRRMARSGYCKQFEYFMAENCRQSCEKCGRTRSEICPGSRMDCSKAPNAYIRKYCEQLQRWDEGARKSTILGSEVALPPGSHSIADLGN